MRWRIDRASGVFMLCLAAGLAPSAQAGPTDAVNPSFQIGSGTVTGLGTANVAVNQSSQLAKIHWDSLGNKVGEVLRYNQPSAGAVALNVIGGADPSQFLGSVFANGSVIFINPNGVFFGPQSQVNVGGLIASSLNITDTNFVNGRYAFEGSAAAGIVRNEGQITAGPYGVYLLAPNVTNSGIITTPGGQIALGAGTTAYLSSRADGHGFLTEVTAPAGDALNVGRMIADGGQVSMIGRLVTQSGLVQANTVQRQNGVVKLVASEQATLSSGSQTVADGGEIAVSGRIIEQQGVVQSAGTSQRSGRVEYVASEQVNLRTGGQTLVHGGNAGVSDGGTIAAMASSPTNGTVTIESGAVLDVSGGMQGGHGGELWLGGTAVPSAVSFLGTANAGYDPGILRTISRASTVTSADLTGGTSRSYLNFYALDDLTVNLPLTGFDLTTRSIAPALDGTARAGTVRFWAGKNLLVGPAQLRNGLRTPSTSTNTVNPWNLAGVAGNDILFQTPTAQTSSWSTGRGNIALQAGRDIKLVPDGGGGATTIQTFDGDIAMTAGRDVIAPSAMVNNQYTGIRLDRVVINATPDQGVGNLYLTAGRNFTGSTVNGVQAGPGFVLSNGMARVRVGGDLGSSTGYATFTVGSAGIVLGGSTPIADSQTAINLDLVSQGDMFIGNMQDRGLSEGLRTSNQVFSTVNQNSAASVTSLNGDIHLRPADITAGGQGRGQSHLLPATVSVTAAKGNVFIESLLEFWSSLVGSLSFTAGQSIVGSPSSGITLNCAVVSGCNPVTDPASPTVSPITLTAGRDITGLGLQLVDSYRKRVTLTAGRNILDVGGVFAVPDFGTDLSGTPVPAVTIAAGADINFTGPEGAGGFLFGGTGLARVTAGGTLNLGDNTNSKGLIFQFDPHVTTSGSSAIASDSGGLLDVAVGGDVKMTQSSIASTNGASIFVHGLAAQDLGAGTVTTVDGQSVLVVNGTVALGLNGKPIVVDNATSTVISAGDLVHGTAVLDRPLVQLADGTIVAVINGKTVFATPSGTAAVDGRPSVGTGGVTLSVDGRSARVVLPVGGSVDVGANHRNSNRGADLLPTGILTVRGGDIDVKATGDVNVNLSRIATFGGGDITVTSTAGDINAGSGARTDVTNFVISQPDSSVQGKVRRTFFQVPGSGIFTYHPQDGDLPNIPRFNPISPFEAEVILQKFLGHDVSALEPLIPAAREAWKNEYDQTVRQLFADFLLGDIKLTAARDVIVPPAGIRGRYITIDAGRNLDLQGGEIRGVSTVNVGSQLVGSLSGFVGAFVVNTGGIGGSAGSTLGLGNITGTVGSVTTTSSVTASTSTASLTSSKAAESAQSSQSVGESDNVSDRDKKKGGKSSAAGSLRIRDKVKIKVETKHEQAM